MSHHQGNPELTKDHKGINGIHMKEIFKFLLHLVLAHVLFAIEIIIQAEN